VFDCKLSIEIDDINIDIDIDDCISIETEIYDECFIEIDIDENELELELTCPITEVLYGPQGEDGKSAYEVAVDEGFVGDEAAWLLSLKGEPGEDGQDGEDAIPTLAKWEHISITSLILANQYIDLMFLVQPDSLQVSFNGIIQYEGENYSLSTVGLVTRFTLLNSLATGGDYDLSTSDKLHFNYRYAP
jgi:hypothetical protein